MDFWCGLTVEIIGGLFTALALGVGAAYYAASQQVRNHDQRFDDLIEDNRRWFRDRDRYLEIEKKQRVAELMSAGQGHAGAWFTGMGAPQERALREYRDEISVKRRRYRELHDAEGHPGRWIRDLRSNPFRRFELTEEQRGVLAKWRADVGGQGMRHHIDDVTSEDREPDLRRFEREGDPPL